jgi:predicted Zn-dependent protease
VLQDKSVNAFALPGGPMFIFSGLVQNVDNEAQLAAVMAHEMAHVILRHSTHQASKANLIKLPLLLAGEALGQQSLLATITNLGANTLIMKYSRDAERRGRAGRAPDGSSRVRPRPDGALL